MILTLANRYGHRGVWLMTMGTIWIVFGIGLIIDSPGQPNRPYVVHDHLPHLVQAAVWIITGAIATWTGHRGPGRNDSWGHVALYVVPATWTASFAASYAVWTATSLLTAAGAMSSAEGFSRGWYSALVWSVIVVMVRLVSSWANPAPPIIPPPRLEQEQDPSNEGRHAR